MNDEVFQEAKEKITKGTRIPLKSWDSIAEKFHVDYVGDIRIDRGDEHIAYLWGNECEYYGKPAIVDETTMWGEEFKYCVIACPEERPTYRMLIPYEAIDMSEFLAENEEVLPPESGLFDLLMA